MIAVMLMFPGVKKCELTDMIEKEIAECVGLYSIAKNCKEEGRMDDYREILGTIAEKHETVIAAISNLNYIFLPERKVS